MAREVPKTQAVAQAALDELAAGTTASEGELGLTSDASFDISGVTIDERRRHARGNVPTSRTGLAQVVYTLTQFPTVKHVEIDGEHYTRADFEDETPAILVESPLAFETVSNPIHATGTANTFEANFQYEVVDPSGKVVDTHFVTATSGTARAAPSSSRRSRTPARRDGRARRARVLGEGRLADERGPHPRAARALVGEKRFEARGLVSELASRRS